MDDETLWDRFHDRSLSSAVWTHEAHLRTAWMHLERWPIDEAHLRIRVGIIRLNAAHGLQETPERGYHETLTRVWLALIAPLRRGVQPPPSTSRASLSFVTLCEGALVREAPLGFYSRERLFGIRARAVFIEPDLAPLP